MYRSRSNYADRPANLSLEGTGDAALRAAAFGGVSYGGDKDYGGITSPPSCGRPLSACGEGLYGVKGRGFLGRSPPFVRDDKGEEREGKGVWPYAPTSTAEGSGTDALSGMPGSRWQEACWAGDFARRHGVTVFIYRGVPEKVVALPERVA